MFEECCCNKIVGYGLPMFVYIKTEHNNRNNVVDIIR